MRLPPIFNKEPEIKRAAIFDIGSGSVGASLVEFDSKSDHPTLIWNGRGTISFQEIPNFEQLTKSMLSTLLDVVLMLQTEGFQALADTSQKAVIDDILFVFASPWHVMQAKVITLEKEKPFSINKSFLDALVGKEEEQFKTGAAKNLGSGTKTKPILIEKQVIQTVLNGYTTQNPYNKTARKAKIDLILSAVPQDVHEKISEIATQMLNGETGEFHSFTLALFSTIRDIFHNKENFLHLDISAEITDVVLVHNGALLETASFPQGKHFLIREVASELNTIPEEASSLVKAYLKGHSSPEQSEKIKAVLSKVSKSWTKCLDEILIKLSENISIPRTVFVTVDDDFSIWFKKTLEKEDFSHLVFSDISFDVVLLDSTLLSNYIEHKDTVSSIDPFLALESLFFKKIIF